ncbi:MAG TPA: GGDEF domain-containing protein, partial [Candidatus Limnocylindria bacterium]|nr:GGDEF domain-containing protein [Candidatus Limnocylindria bacterium]
PVALTVGAALTLGVAAAARLAEGLTSGRLADLVECTALASLAAGLAAGVFHAASQPTTFPDGGLPLAMLVCGLLLLAARLTPPLQLTASGRRVALVTVLVIVEAVLAASLFAPIPQDVAPWMSAAAAAAAAAGSIPGPVLTGGLLAGAFAGMTAIRPGALDAAAPLAAMMAAAVAATWPGTARDDADEASAPEPITHTALVPPAPRPTRATGGLDDEALRLARELRGTIEELLQARHTIELQRMELARTAAQDPLTGVASRRELLERLTVEVAEARRYSHPVAVVLVDIDGFAELNHAHGLAIGDAVLRDVALRLRVRTRAADALGRVGADSFLVVVPHTDERGAAVFADAVRRTLAGRPVGTDAGEIDLSVSIGVAFMEPGMELTTEQLLAAVDEALASARAAGGNRIAFDRRHGLVRLEERRAGGSADTGRDASAG